MFMNHIKLNVIWDNNFLTYTRRKGVKCINFRLGSKCFSCVKIKYVQAHIEGCLPTRRVRILKSIRFFETFTDFFYLGNTLRVPCTLNITSTLILLVYEQNKSEI